MTNEAGRYHLQVFDLDGRRRSSHHCDGTYDMEQDLLNAVQALLEDGVVGSILIRDQLRIDNAKPKPLGEALGATENVGSCEPGPDLRRPGWDKTQGTWFTDVDRVGRYSVRRPRPRMPYEAYLNGKSLNLMPDSDPEVLKRSIDRRILEARRINHVTDKPEAGSPGPELLAQRMPQFGKRKT